MNNSKKLILASSSEERMRMLTASGYKVDSIVPANIDESELKGEMPKALAFRLAFEKVQKVSQEFPNDVVIGADTVVSVGRTSLPKALLESDAKLCLDKLSGRRHVVYTGICLAHNSIFRKKVAMSIVKFKHLTEEEKSFYVESKEWYGKAGGYAIRGKASSFIQYIRGLDSTINSTIYNHTKQSWLIDKFFYLVACFIVHPPKVCILAFETLGTTLYCVFCCSADAICVNLL